MVVIISIVDYQFVQYITVCWIQNLNGLERDVMTKAILVTGASTGIGYALSKHLAAEGHRVYATARNDADCAKLEKLANVFPLILDVRNVEHVENARRIVEAEGLGLYGLVNNAGIGHLGFLNTFNDDEMHDLFDINVHGPHRITNAFLDLLLESEGRIVNIGSQGGSVSMKYYGPYTMTKHALEAYSVALAAELDAHGVNVSIVQPGGIATEIFEKMLPPTIDHFERSQPPFSEEANAVIEALKKPSSYDESQPESATNRNPSSTDIVTEAVVDALFSEKPKQRYLVGTRWEGNRVINMLLDRLLDANECQTLNYSRDELIDWLDGKLSERAA